jgi:hypothetical protein
MFFYETMSLEIRLNGNDDLFQHAEDFWDSTVAVIVLQQQS